MPKHTNNNNSILDIYNDGVRYDQMFNFTEDLEFWINEASKYEGPVLELCCGTGRLLVPIARKGISIHGLDNSIPMLNVAQEKLTAENLNSTLFCQDVRNFFTGIKYSFIYLPQNSICHLHKIIDIKNLFSAVRMHMEKGSVFAIDVFLPNFNFIKKYCNKDIRFLFEYNDPIDGKKVKLYEKSLIDFSQQLLISTLMFEKSNEKWIENFTMRLFFPQEIETLVELCGFHVLEKYGDYNKSNLCESSARQLIFCSI